MTQGQISRWDPLLETELRSFERVTDDPGDIRAFKELIEEKDLDGGELKVIFRVLRVRPGVLL